MKIHLYIFILLLLYGNRMYAQADTTQPVKVAVFIPLFVDDVFTGSQYTYDSKSLPKHLMQGLEFYNGVMMAIDSMQQEGIKAEISIYDTKKRDQTLDQVLKSNPLNNVGLIIAAITNTTELKLLSAHGLVKNIPVISATFPNYVGVTANPFFVLLNSSFQAHLQGLVSHMQKQFGSNTIIAITKKGSTEDYIKSYVTQANKASSHPLKFKWQTVSDSNFNISHISSSLDSTKENIVFVASPSESFGLKIVQELAKNDLYPVTAVGMPTWDGIKAMNRKEYRNVNIIYSTPFLYSSQNYSLSQSIADRYKEKYYSRPSDMVYKGYETVYHFTRLLVKHRNNLINNLSDKDFTLFNHFQLEPVKLKSTSIQPDLIENKKLYFIKKQNGMVKSIL